MALAEVTGLNILLVWSSAFPIGTCYEKIYFFLFILLGRTCYVGQKPKHNHLKGPCHEIVDHFFGLREIRPTVL